MDMTPDQIDAEFIRQVRLCSSLGQERMLEIVLKRFEPKTKLVEQGSNIQPKQRKRSRWGRIDDNE